MLITSRTKQHPTRTILIGNYINACINPVSRTCILGTLFKRAAFNADIYYEII